jgi:hypothetical protein
MSNRGAGTMTLALDRQGFYGDVMTRVQEYLYQQLGLIPDAAGRKRLAAIKAAHAAGGRVKGVAQRYYEVARVSYAPRLVSVDLAIDPSHYKRLAGLRDELSMAARLDRDVALRVARGRAGYATVEIPLPQALWQTVRASDLPRACGSRVRYAIDRETRSVVWDFADSLTPHLLIAGTTGSGKSNAQRLFVHNLVRYNNPGEVRLVLIDVRKCGRAWREFASVPHLLHPVVADEDEAARVLAHCVAEIAERGRDDRVRPAIYIAVDEAQSILAREDIRRLVDDIAATGREFRVHLLLATQNPTAENLGTANIKRNMARLVGRVTDSIAAQVATGASDSGAEKLLAAGDMLRVDPEGIERVTVAYLDPRQLTSLPHTDAPQSLDLGQYDSADRVRAVAGRGDEPPQADPLDPHQVACAIALDCGITKLAQELGIGSAKARRILEFSRPVRASLEALGYTIPPPKSVPTPEKQADSGE